MKIKGPPDYTGPPTPPESNGVEKKAVSKFGTDPSADIKPTSPANRKQPEVTDSFEKDLRKIAKTSGPQGPPGEEAVSQMVDSVLQEVLGKEFMSKPEAARLKEALVPMIHQDEQMMGKLGSLLNRLGKL